MSVIRCRHRPELAEVVFVSDGCHGRLQRLAFSQLVYIGSPSLTTTTTTTTTAADYCGLRRLYVEADDRGSPTPKRYSENPHNGKVEDTSWSWLV